MLSQEGHLKVVDFSVSILCSDDEAPGLKGAPSYMAAELVYGLAANEQSDLFSVAVVLYEMITG